MMRHADPTLLDVEELIGSLHGGATQAEADRWWTLVLKLEASLDADPRCSKLDLDTMRRIRERVSAVYERRNKGNAADYTSARVALTGLQTSLEMRTTGLDGHRLR